MEYLIKAFIIKTDERLKTHSVVIRNLERQVGHIASLLSEKSVGTLSADTKRNPNETINVVSLRNGKILQDPLVAEKELTENQVKNEGEQISDEHHRNEMPAYAKFLKEIWSKKRKVEETSVVKLTEHCSAILQNKLSQKCGNPGSLTIPCSLISTKFENLYLADQTTIIPEGIMEDILVQVDKFMFPVDFIVVNMEENREIPLILGRPFLAIGRAILDIQESQAIKNAFELLQILIDGSVAKLDGLKLLLQLEFLLSFVACR
ncbi:uncharacterized protein LOC142169755 [Nicotiana tabacum]|uniref:Uncharacterized protein LOC142169755 n=1 Tax=Nicotiana tabacum TaxID=4097 RepID=A0AC58SS24_TOBAC